MSDEASEARRHRREARRPVQTVTLLIGIVFVLLGVLGFIPGVTANLGQLHAKGPASGALLFGVFSVSVLYNVIHLLTGVIGLAAALRRGASRVYLTFGGGAYLLLWFYGIAADHHSAANFGPFNPADNWLTLGLAAGMIALGFGVTAREQATGRYPTKDSQRS
jgi:uncharacterized protein DUF4383